MTEIIRLTCPACGGKLELTEDIERFACSYCGNEHMVVRRGGIVTLKPVVEGLERVKVSTDRTASELALVRLEKEIGQLRADLAAARPRWAYLYASLLLGFLILITAIGITGGLNREEALLSASACLAAPSVLAIMLFLVWLSSYLRSRSRRRELEPVLEAKRDEYHRHYLLLEAMDSAKQRSRPRRTVGRAD